LSHFGRRALDSILFDMVERNLTIGLGISHISRAATLQSDKQVYQTSLAFIGYCNPLPGKLDKSERL
jgi:hypothetical protein